MWKQTGDGTGQDCAKELDKLGGPQNTGAGGRRNDDEMLETELEPEDREWQDAGARHPDVKHAAHDLGLFAYVHSSSGFTYMKVLFF